MPSPVCLTAQGVEYVLLAFIAHIQRRTPAVLQPQHVPLPSQTESCFYSVNLPPEISPLNYGRRLLRHCKASPAVIIYAIVLLQRSTVPKITLHNLHRLLITAIVVSVKLLDTAYYSNKYYATVGGVPTVAEMNLLERELLKLLQYDLYVAPEQLFAYYRLAISNSFSNHNNNCLLYTSDAADE